MEFKHAKRICILNLIPNTLGDSLYLIGITRVIKKNLPNATIAVTCAPLTEQLLKREPTINELKIFPVLADIGKPASKWKKAKMYLGLMKDLRAYLKEEQFDACIVTLPLFAPTQLIPWLAGVPIRVGYTFKGSIFSFLLTHKTQARGAVYSGEKSRHFRQTSLDLMRLLDLPFTDDETRIRYEPTAEDLKAAHEALAKLPKKPFIAFQAGAKWPDKRWPEERFGELAKRITDAHDVHIILTGSKDEFESNEKIKSYVGDKATNLCTGVPLATLAGILRNCKLLIGNTSGILHFASAIGTPTVGLHWVAVTTESEPFGIGKTISVGGSGFCGDPECERMANPVFNNGCRHSIPVDAVWKAVDEFLKKELKSR